MVAGRNGGLVGALDVGTTKVACFIARTDGDDYRVIGVGHQPAHGMKGGVVVDMEAAETAIGRAVAQAERMAGEKLRDVYVTYSGAQVRSQIMEVEVDVHGGTVEATDLHRLGLQCRGAVEAGMWDILHTIPLDFSVDGARGIRDPRRMMADRLSARMHVVAVPHTQLRNLALCIERCMLGVRGVTVSAYASGLACLSSDRMELGATLVDMGGGATSIAVFQEGRLAHLGSIPVGGCHVTGDIARGLHTSTTAAERLKTLWGSAMPCPRDELETLEVPPAADGEDAALQEVSRSVLTGVIGPRLEETLELVRERLELAGFARTAGRHVVLTGGACQVPGLADLAARVLDKQVTVGRPHGVRGLAESAVGPAFTACAGLLRFADVAEEVAARHAEDIVEPDGFWGRVGRWLKENF